MSGLFSMDAWSTVWNHKESFLLGLGNTLQTAVCALALAFAIGALLGLMATSGNKILKFVARVYVEFIQNTPLLLQLCFLYYALAFAGLSLGVIRTGIIALGVYTGAYMGEVVRGGLNGVAKGQFEAGYAQGFNTAEVLLYIVLPQAYRNIVPTLLSQVITTIKDSSYLANVATIELMARIRQLLSAAGTYNGLGTVNVSDVMVLFGAACVIYFIINFTLSCIVRSMQNKRKKALVFAPAKNAA